MEQKAGGGLGMTAEMQTPVDHGSYYRKAKAERDRVQAEKERKDAEDWAKLKANRERMDRQYAPLTRKVQRNLQSSPDEIPVSKEKLAEIKRRSGKPAMWPEMTSLARIRVEEEAEAPVDPGIFGFGLLGTVRKIFWHEIEQIHKETEANRLLHRAAIF